MKKVVFSIVVALGGCLAFSGCIKHPVNQLTINPTMTATIGTTTFTALSVVPSVTTNQVNDSTTQLTITGNLDLLQNTPGDQIILTITKYKNLTGTFSLVQGQCTETYIHNGITSLGTSGIVSVTNITANSIIGYFSFATADGYTISNGNFNVGKPF